MSAEIASLERVRDAVETIRRRNGTPTADGVIVMIGGGSKKTVLSHLRTLRDPQLGDDGVPPAILELARHSLAEIFRAGGQAEADRSRILTERLSTALNEQEAQIEELADESSRHLQAIQELTRQRDNAVSDRKRLEKQLAEVSAAKRALETDLAQARLKRSEGIEQAIARIETLVKSTATGIGTAGEGRKTISLPKGSGDARR